MKVVLAKHAGFCFGVERAVTMAEGALKKHQKVASLGPIIHNEQVVDYNRKKGIQVVTTVDNDYSNKILIRTNGVGKSVYQTAQTYNMEVIDATCPFVKKIQDIVAKESKKGRNILILGDETHPEVLGIKGWSESNVIVFNDFDQIKNLDESKPYSLVAQTTMNLVTFKEIENLVIEKFQDVEIFNTVCLATKQRQEAALELSKEVDAMVVIGGKNSSNTQKLFAICQNEVKAYVIETFEDLDIQELKNYSTIGVTAGASTPDWIIKDVVRILENL